MQHSIVFVKNYGSLVAEDEIKRALPGLTLGAARLASENGLDYALLLIGTSSDWCEVLAQLKDYQAEGIRILCIGVHELPMEHGKIWSLLENGADEYLPWRQVSDPGKMVAERLRRWQAIDQMLHTEKVTNSIIGQSPRWRKLLRQLIEAAHFSTSHVLLLGESGTGKELLAQLIHQLDRRSNKGEFVITDCTTLSPELAGSELFGHEKGAFTNAMANRDGAFALADGGTLFLDEIGELPLPIQAELLRSIQEGMYKRVGSNFWRKSQFRLVAATHRDLTDEVAHKRFRQDLFFRISGCICHVPPLRERTEDILPLANFFLQKALDTVPLLDEAVRTYLLTREYNGNVRELQQLMARIAYRHPDPALPITVGDLPEIDRPTSAQIENPWDDPALGRILRCAFTNGIGLKEIKRIICNKAMELCIGDENGNLQNAAQRLQVSDRTIQLYSAALKNGGNALNIDL